MPLTNNQITLFAVVRESSPGVWTKIAEQDNFPILEEFSNPVGTWHWNTDGIVNGMSATPSITVTSLGGDGKQAEIAWSGIVPSDWRNGVSGFFDVSLIDDDGNSRGPYTIILNVRSVEHIEFTAIEGQTAAGMNPVYGMAPGEPDHTWVTTDTPPGSTITFTADGRINVIYGGNWSNVNGTFWLTLSNGTGSPESTFNGLRTAGGASLPKIKLRRLIGDGYTAVQNQFMGGDGISGATSELYSFTPTNLPPGATLSFNQRGALIGATALNWDGTSDGEFDLEVQDGNRPSSFFYGAQNRKISFRSLIGNGYTFVEGQTSSGNGINAPGFWEYLFTPTSFSPGAGLTVDAMGKVLSAFGSGNATFDLEIQDGPRPSSTFVGRQLQFRSIPPIKIGCSGGPCTAIVDGEAGNPWHWQAFSENMPVTEVAAGLGTGTTGLTLTPTVVQPGDTGTATLTLQKVDGGGVPLRPACTVAVPISTNIAVRLKGTTDVHDLPGGRARMRYQAALEAVTTVEAGKELLWSVDFLGDATLAAALDLAASNTGTATDNVLATRYDSVTGATSYLPDTSGTKTFTVTVIKRDAATLEECASSGPVTFVLPIAQTHDNVNVTILLDRSGSMSSQHRWQAACSGAGSFAVLAKAAVDAGEGSHKLGVYWFNSNPNPAAAFQHLGTGSYSINGGVALADAANVGTVCASQSPAKLTALGNGLLLCRDDLAEVDTGNEEKVLLVLSDGMENQSPKTTEIFFNTASPNYWGSPNIRIYPLALMTGSTWVERLESIVGATSGLPALDVTAFPVWSADTPSKINDWFVNMFTQLFGFTTLLAPPDPALAKGKSASHEVPVHLGQNTLIFHVTHDTPGVDDWQFDLELPGDAGTITKGTAAGDAGIRYFETPMSKMYVVDFPITLPGLEHCWVGNWNMVVTRKADGTGHYGVGALAKQDVSVDIQVLCEAVPHPGNTAVIRAEVKDPNGKPLTDAKITAEITPPDRWIGDRLLKTAQKDPSVYRVIGRSKSVVNTDIENDADKLWQHLQGTIKPKPGPVQNLTLKHMGKGVYLATYKLKEPGEYNIDVTCIGNRTAPSGELSAKRQTVLNAATANLTALRDSLTTAEINKSKKQTLALFAKAAPSKQKFHVQTRRSLKVGFLPDAANTIRYGFLEDANTICLHVEPKDKTGRLLGPGWADQVVFTTPAGMRHAAAAKDMLDGTYELEIPMSVNDPHICLACPTIVDKKLALSLPGESKPVALKGGALPLLEGFSVSVLGHKMPLTVFALAGNKKTKQAHFVTCAHVPKITDENFEWFTDLKDIQKHGFDTCEICMPLVINTAAKEVHKPLCTRVSKIAVKNRKEIRSLSTALKQGCDGCKYCLPGSHKR